MNTTINNLHTIEAYTNISAFYNPLIMDCLILLSLICAFSLTLNKNPIVSVLYLIGLYITIACYLFIIGTQFMGLSYILVFVGAISILFIFILMLINIRISELISNNKNSIPLVLIITVLINSMLFTNLPGKNILYSVLHINNDKYYLLESFLYQITESNALNITNIKWSDNILDYNIVTSLGNILYSHAAILLIIISGILLLAMIGAISITNRPTLVKNRY